MLKTALITGITGQDGAYLAHHLLSQGYRVVGTTRNFREADFSKLKRLDILFDVKIVSLDPLDAISVRKSIDKQMPGEIYNLSGQTSVGLSYEKPKESVESICTATLNFLEAIRTSRADVKFFNPGSSECFGSTGKIPATEETPLSPSSPYAVAKAAAFWLVSTYRQAYGLFACTGILSNHESPLRPSRFVTQKVIQGIKEIKKGRSSTIRLNSLGVWRDWGWAPDYVQAMALMLQSEKPNDYIIASGNTTSLRDFVYTAFAVAGLSPDTYIQITDAHKRPTDISYSAMCSDRIHCHLGWSSDRSIAEIVSKMYNDELF